MHHHGGETSDAKSKLWMIAAYSNAFYGETSKHEVRYNKWGRTKVLTTKISSRDLMRRLCNSSKWCPSSSVMISWASLVFTVLGQRMS